MLSDKCSINICISIIRNTCEEKGVKNELSDSEKSIKGAGKIAPGGKKKIRREENCGCSKNEIKSNRAPRDQF